jgi:RNA polymerase sigma-70 factor (ECF subfamily)
VSQDAVVEREPTAARVAEAYASTHAKLWRAVLAFSGSRDITDDAVAEAFAQALRRGDEIRDVVAWVWRAAFALARGHLADRSATPPVAQLPAAMEADAAQRVVELIAVLGELDDRDRELLVLHHVGGWTPTELSRISGTPAATVRVRLHRAHQRARELFEDEEVR